MTKYQALAWMGKQIYASKLMGEKCENVEMCGVVQNEIHVYKGVATLADAIGVPYSVTMKTNSEYPVRIWFMFDGYKFLQIERTLEDATDVRNS